VTDDSPETAPPDRTIDLARIREAHERRGSEIRRDDPHRRIVVRAQVRTLDNLVKEARVGRFTLRSDEAAELGGDGSAPNPLAFFVASIGFCLLTQLTRACALEDLALESVDMDIRASFPLENKYGVSDLSAACERVTYTADVRGAVDPERLRAAFAWAESVCHVVRSLKEPVEVATELRLNGEPIAAD
jgi:uncharacterized OsmC-like protein